MRNRIGLSLLSLFILCAGVCAVENETSEPFPSVLDAVGVKGGLIVCIGCDDPSVLVALRPNDSYVVHGLDTDADQVATARTSLHERGLYGPVSVQQWDGLVLPYVDNLVNAIVLQDVGCEISPEEIIRALAPRGVAIGRENASSIPQPASRIAPAAPSGEGYVAFTKPVPPELDEWTHFLHGPDNNALAEDTVVGAPRHMQWHSEPIWGRHHHAEKGTQPTIRTVVSSQGRLFSLIDETETSDMKVPSKWTIVARDAFSGVLLWKRPVQAGEYPRRLEQVWRQLIADGDRLYAVLGDGQPLSRLNAVDGAVTGSYPGSEGLSEVIKDGNTLFVLRGDDRIVAFHSDTTAELWTWSPGDDDAVIRGTLAASAGKVFVKTGKAVACMSADRGTALWRVPLPGPERNSRLAFPHEKLLVNEGVVLCSYAGKDPTSLKRDIDKYLGSHPRVHEYGGTLGAFSADDGEQLWETAYLPNLESAPGEIYVHDGQVWLGPAFAEPRDLRTGKVRKTNHVIDRLWTDGHHYRCYPGKATSRFIITAKRGIELIDMTGEDHSRNNWVRGTCRVGVTPCNGLLYAPSHSCGCYMEAKLFGFWSLASSRAPAATAAKDAAPRLQKGPAYDPAAIPPSPDHIPDSERWWTFRGSSERGAATATQVPADLKQVWRTQLGGKLSAATVDRATVFVAQVDTHAVHALDATTGTKLWSFTAGGRVDSPPTLVAGRVLFGSRDGYVYCLRASDGELAWRFLAAPRRLHAVAFDQPESVWPVHGSVVFHRGVVYAAAGRSTYLDGGIMLLGLDPVSGEVVVERRLASEHAGAMEPPEHADKYALKNRQNWLDYKTKLAPDQSDSFAMQGATTDILVADGESIYLRNVRFDRNLVEQPTKRAHLFATSSLLDGWEHNRSYWVLGTGDFSNTPVAFPWILKRDIQVPFGLMMAFDEKTVWGVHRAKGYSVFAMSRPDPTLKERAFPDFQARTSAKKVDSAGWQVPLGIRPRTLVRAGDLLFLGGMSADQPGGQLHVVACRDGETVGKLPIASPPVWDSMAAAHGRLFIPCTDGSVICLSGR